MKLKDEAIRYRELICKDADGIFFIKDAKEKNLNLSECCDTAETLAILEKKHALQSDFCKFYLN